MGKRIKVLSWSALILLLTIFWGSGDYALAEMEYITISVEASDDNGNLQYAIDEPVNFSASNTFTIPAGTSHTIYVKDAAGNITSQEYFAGGSSHTTVVSSEANTSPSADSYEITTDSGDQEINIDLELGMKTEGIITEELSPSVSGDYENYEYLTDTVIEPSSTTVQSKTTTDGSDTAEKVFYSITTAEGETFYLVIEQGASNGVHLLNTVTLDDLEKIAAAEGGAAAATEEKEDNLLEALNKSENALEMGAGTEMDSAKKSESNDLLLIIAFAAIAGGGFYYFKVYRNKKNAAMDAMDAMDMDEFQSEEDDVEIEFDEFDDEQKQHLLDELIAADEYAEENELYHADPEEYSEAAGMNEKFSKAEPEEELPFENKTQKEAISDEKIAKVLSEAEEYDEELDGTEEE